MYIYCNSKLFLFLVDDWDMNDHDVDVLLTADE